MANYNNLKSAIQDVIKVNGNQEITGDILQNALLSMINSLGAGYQFMGVATPKTNPGTPDQKVFYIASTDGNYVNFGGAIIKNSISVLLWDGSWTAKEVISMTGYNQSKSVSLITSPAWQSPNIPHISVVDGTISFGPENAFVVGNDLYQINNSEPLTLAIKPTKGNHDLQTSAIKLVLNTEDSSIRTIPLADDMSANDVLIGTFRVNYGEKLTHIFGVNMPFEYTIDDTLQYDVKPVLFVCGTPTDIMLPICDTQAKTITFGNESTLFFNDKKYDISGKVIALNEDIDSSCKKIWFNTQTCEFKSLAYSKNKPSVDDILIGAARIPYNNAKIQLSLPFNVSFNGRKDVANYYDPEFRGYAASPASNVVFIPSPNHKNIPNIDTSDGTISFGEENAFIVGNNKYQINNSKPFTLAIKPTEGSDIQTSAVKLVLNTQDSSIRTMPLADALSDNDILVGTFRVNYGPTFNYIFGVNLPFEYTIDGGSPENYGFKSHNYEGDKVEIGNSVQVKRQGIPFPITELQGMTAFDKYLIRTGNEQGGRCNIMNVKDGSILGDFILASNSDVNHANCVELGEKYSSEDILPLIYVSEATVNYRCFVERIKNDFSGSSLIQTITFAGTYTKGIIGNDWAVDIYNKRLFNCISTSNLDCQVLVFNLPDYNGGDITLTDTDIIDTLNFPVQNILQGVTYNSGKLFFPIGLGNATYPSDMIVYDITRKLISSRVNLQTMIPNEEPEDVCVLDNQLLLGTQSTGIYWFKF